LTFNYRKSITLCVKKILIKNTFYKRSRWIYPGFELDLFSKS
jgi:hypothetical protein